MPSGALSDGRPGSCNLAPLLANARRKRRLRLLIRLVEFLFVAFFVYVLVGGQFLENRSVVTLANNFSTGGEGDTLRQVFYLMVFVAVNAITYWYGGFEKYRVYPLALSGLVLWGGITTLTAVVPDVSMRRFFLSVIVLTTIIDFVYLLGVRRAIELLRSSLAFTILASLAVIPFVPEAVHPVTEADAELVGAWKGVFYHKNIAAPICVVTFVLYLFSYIDSRRLGDLAIAALSLLFLWGTKGKSAQALLLASIFFGITYYLLLHARRRLGIVWIINCLMVLALSGGLLLFDDRIANYLSDPNSFTGRVAIWQVVLRYAEMHPIMGAGYGSFWEVGDAGPARLLTDRTWIVHEAHSHNGYLETLVTTGVPGLALALLSVVVLPFLAFRSIVYENKAALAALFTVWLFSVWINTMESQIFSRDRQVWMVLVTVIAILKQLHTPLRRPALASLLRPSPAGEGYIGRGRS